MAYKIISSLLPILLIFSIILAMAGEAVAARKIYEWSAIGDKKQPQWWVGYDGVSVLIPGIGRVTLPPHARGGSGGNTGSYGDSGGNTGSYGSDPSPSRGYIPGGDDTFVPNPGFEAPNPASIGVKVTPYP